MRTTITPVLVTITGALVWAMLAGASVADPSSGSVETKAIARPSFQRIKAEVPAALRKYLYDRCVALAIAAYPRVDVSLIRKDVAEYLLRKEQVFDVSRAGGVTRYGMDGGKSGIYCSFDVPLDRISVGTFRVPAGVEVKGGQEPLSERQARSAAEGVVERVIGEPERRKQFVLAKRGMDKEGRYYWFEWGPKEGGEGRGINERIRVLVNRKDGIIRAVTMYMDAIPVKPRISREEMIAKAKTAITGFQPDYLKPGVLRFYTASVNVWRYEVPPPPMGLPRDKTIWSADTGEVLYSEATAGGTQDKPYRSREFFFDATKDALRSRLHRLLEDLARKVSKEQGKAGTQRA